MFDWSALPKTYNDKIVYAANGTLLVYYTGIPSRKAICLKNDNGEVNLNKHSAMPPFGVSRHSFTI
ncbi:11075_t:CDS:2 [Funneliformis mosseae]|uniref:11075_t:CDS:1 n=1 Tax=Funneliformis mosseae TaxID=27381 RepID=A0A9N8V6Q6_FUNMO|nr:11075_t:CDS:2 [Funneliformis mosseae]